MKSTKYFTWEKWTAMSSHKTAVTLILLGLFAMLVFFRDSEILLEGRFWAEDGNVFFKKAYVSKNSLMTFLSPAVGYYSFPNRFAGFMAANWMPIEYAPLLSCWLAFGFTLLPSVIILCSDIKGIRTIWHKSAILALLLFTMPNLETWLTLTCSHFNNALAVAFILVSTCKSPTFQKFRYFILVTAGLNTALPCFFAPFFWLYWFFDKKPEKLKESIFISLVTLIQFAVFITATTHGKRFGEGSFLLLSYVILMKQFFLTMGGWEYANSKVNDLKFLYSENHWQFAWIVPTLYAIVSFLIIKYRDKVAGFLFFSGTFVLVLSFYTTIGLQQTDSMAVHIHPLFGGRYFLIPNILFLFSLFVLSTHVKSISQKITSCLISVFLLWVVLVGAINYRPSKEPFDDVFFAGPSWREEVEKWEEDPSYQLQIWPSGWSMSLPKNEDRQSQ